MRLKITVIAFLIGVTGVCTAAQTTYVRATVDEKGQLHIETSTGSVITPPTGPGPLDGLQTGFSKPQITPDKHTVGWLALYENCCQSYAIPLQLFVFRDGKVVQRFPGIPPIWEWSFEDDGKHVAFVQRPTHGSAPDHYELRDVESGKLLEQYDQDNEESKDRMPAWAQQLKWH